MWKRLFDGFDWVINCVTQFETHHWLICLAILLAIGFASMRGLGVRGAR
jgi:hypothetical protein